MISGYGLAIYEVDRSQLCKDTGLIVRKVDDALRDLEESGHLERVGPTDTQDPFSDERSGVRIIGVPEPPPRDEPSPDLVDLDSAIGAPTTDAPSAVETPTRATPNREVDYRCAVMDYPGKLTTGARYTGVAIVRHCWKTGELFAGAETVAEWIGLAKSSRKTASKYLDELEEAGFLTRIGNAGRASKYRLTLP